MLLKEKLLQTGAFIDNSQLDSYVAIVTKTTNQRYGEKHHIIPRSYYKLNKQKIDNSKNNLIKLSYFDHILAHYYLSFCTIGRLKQSNIGAFIMLVETGLDVLTKDELSAIKYLENYAKLKEDARALRQQQCAAIGKIKTEAHKQALKNARDLHATTKGKKAIYNPELDKVKFVAENEVIQFLAQGWQLGSKPLSDEAKSKIGISNHTSLLGKKHQVKQDNQIYSGLTYNKVLCVETGQIFDNIRLAAQWLMDTVGIQGGQIKNCCAGARETTGGYHWQYIKEENR